jgi:DNA-binding transcriptional ArsR family regulator
MLDGAMSRPLPHPAIEDMTVAGILHALSDPLRLAIIDELLEADREMNCTETAARLELEMPKSTCSLHYRILREAGLIWSERRGVELTSRVRVKELEARFPGLLASIVEAHRRDRKRARRRAPSR